MKSRLSRLPVCVTGCVCVSVTGCACYTVCALVCVCVQTADKQQPPIWLLFFPFFSGGSLLIENRKGDVNQAEPAEEGDGGGAWLVMRN